MVAKSVLLLALAALTTGSTPLVPSPDVTALPRPTPPTPRSIVTIPAAPGPTVTIPAAPRSAPAIPAPATAAPRSTPVTSAPDRVPPEPSTTGGMESDGIAGQLRALLDDVRATGVTCPGESQARTNLPFTADARLARAAQEQADFIAGSGQVTHEGPDGSHPRDRAAEQGVTSEDVTEIVYLGQSGSFDRAVAWWLDSPVHCAILADAQYRAAGVSVRRGDHGTAYVVVLGGTIE